MEFRPLSREDKPRLDAALAADPPTTSELTFTNLWAWSHKRAVATADDGAGGLLLLCAEGTRRFFLPPVNARDPVAAARALLGHARDAGFPFAVERASAAVAGRLASGGFVASPDRDNYDYLYAVSDLATLRGRRFDGKRNQVRRLTRERACVYEPLAEATVAECLALAEAWCDLRSCALEASLEAERQAIRACLLAHRDLGLAGGAVRVDGSLKAFTLAERLNADTAVVHFEKADPAIPGLYALVSHWFCREALGAFAFVNREQDLGLPGLRAAKESWHPRRLVEKFTLGPPAG